MDLELSPTAELTLLPVFVYGTLRAGGSLHHLLSPYLLEGPHPASVTGRLGVAEAGCGQYYSTEKDW